MIQCIGSRQPQRQYCSRVCCEQAIHNALKIKDVQPDVEIHILHRDIRVPDFEEDNYSEAIEKGVQFIRMDQLPEVSSTDGKFEITVTDRTSNQKRQLTADLVVLSTGIVPHPMNQQVAKILSLPIDSAGFFETNAVGLPSLQSSHPGIFIAGLAHSPQRFESSLMQGSAVAGKIGVLFRSGRLR